MTNGSTGPLPTNGAVMRAIRRSLIVLAVLAAAGLASLQSAGAATFKLLYSFCALASCADGSYPLAGMIMDSAGNFFGTATGGGANDKGVVYELVPNATKTKYTQKVIYSFCAKASCTDGTGPVGELIMDSSGNIFGATSRGGAADSGVVFELMPNGAKTKWTYKVLYSFCAKASCADGSIPGAGLVMDSMGNLFGTAQGDGKNGGGVVYELAFNAGTGKYTQKVLYNFCGKASCADGTEPGSALIMDSSKNLFGTTFGGGNGNSGNGTVFELVFNAGTGKYTEKVLYSFCPGNDCSKGGNAAAGVAMDGMSNLFGTTVNGGKYGDGTAYALIFNAGTGKYTENVLYSFCAKASCIDGSTPSAGVMLDNSGNVYTTTYAGGKHSGGAVVGLTPSMSTGKYAETVLYNFCTKASCADGEAPLAVLIMDGSGNLFSTAINGGANAAGSVFELMP